MSDKETQKIEVIGQKVDALEQKVDHISLALIGDETLGISGLVGTLNGHIEQSKRNNEAILNEFKTFKRDVIKDYADDFNRVDEKQKWTDGRVKVLEEIDRSNAKKHGFIAGISVIFGAALTYLISMFK